MGFMQRIYIMMLVNIMTWKMVIPIVVMMIIWIRYQ